MEQLEVELAHSLEICLDAIVEWTRTCLSKANKTSSSLDLFLSYLLPLLSHSSQDRSKNEFKPQDPDAINAPCTAVSPALL